jgi:hypothetical protein
MLTDQVTLDIEDEVKVGLDFQKMVRISQPRNTKKLRSHQFVLQEDQFEKLIRMSQHQKPKKSQSYQVEPKGTYCFFSYFISSLFCYDIYLQAIIFVVDYMCTKEDIDLIEHLKSANDNTVLVNIDGTWLDKKDMECMFHDNIKFNGEVSTYFKLFILIFKLVCIWSTYYIVFMYVKVLSAYIHCIRDEAQLLNRECGKVFLENTFICSLLMRDGDPDVALSYKTDTIKERVQNYLEADMVKLSYAIFS